jgi:hypothetical protein
MFFLSYSKYSFYVKYKIKNMRNAYFTQPLLQVLLLPSSVHLTASPALRIRGIDNAEWNFIKIYIQKLSVKLVCTVYFC